MRLEARARGRIKEAEAARLARQIYGLEVSARVLPGEYDDNFHLTAGDGRAFVLKVMHPAREPSFLDLQARAMAHLAKNAPQLPLPRVVPNPAGELFSEITTGHGSQRLVWLLGFLPGTVLANVRPHALGLLRDLGRFLGELDAALQSFEHPAAHRELKWDSSRAVWIKEYIREIPGAARQALVHKFLALYEAEVVPRLPRLRRSVIYGDANDYNVLVSEPWPQPRKIAGVIDFGDMHHGLTVSEAAVAAAYAILGKADPLQAAAEVAAGYQGAFPLGDEEVAALFPLMAARLAVSVTNSAHRKKENPGDAYVTVSEEPAWNALEQLAAVHPRLAHYRLRAACGMTPVPNAEKVRRWLKASGNSAAQVLDVDLRGASSLVFDLGVGSLLLGADPTASDTPALTETILLEMRRAGVCVGVGRYNEARPLYRSALFGSVANPVAERRTIHLGMDLFVEPGTTVRAPFAGVVDVVANNQAPGDYGPLVILRHETADREEFFTLYGHLQTAAPGELQVGQRVSRGAELGRVGASAENGGWPPHLHFQIILDLFDLGAAFPGVAYASEREVWTSLSPDPNLLLGIPADRFPPPQTSFGETLEQRRALLGKNLNLSYVRPLKIVRGWMQYLYDDTGRAYLDVYNNVPLVGHSHPRVVRAAQEQLALLNTNTRYLHEGVNRYAERLAEKLPAPLGVCFFVNSGSEANELAVRLARAHTGGEDLIVLEHAYHGHTTTLIDLSPYKFHGPGGQGRKPWVHVAPLPDDYRGLYRREDREAGRRYARHVEELLERARGEGRPVAAFIAESLPSVGGQIVFPPGYLEEVYRHVRAAGALAIADEVQVGFGRLGTHFWGFETQGVVPDIVVLGKPIGNAFPMAAVVTTKEVAASFANGMEFFSTFGGNPVAAAAGLAVLDVLEQEKLQENALRVGTHLKNRLRELQLRHALVGDVRGSGLFLGVDAVLNRATREPAPLQASYVVNRLRESGILTGTDGPHQNVIKLRPPLIVTDKDADLFVSALEAILEEDAAEPRPYDRRIPPTSRAAQGFSKRKLTP